MDKYKRVERPKEVHEDVKEKREVHVTSQGKMRNYISYTLSLFEEDSAKPVTLKAMGRAINKTVTIVEITKRRVVGLHQETTIGSVDVKDTWEPLEEGLDVLRSLPIRFALIQASQLKDAQVQLEKANKIAMDDDGPAVPPPAAANVGRGRGGRGDRGGGVRGGDGGRGAASPHKGGPRLRGARGGGRGRGPRRGGGAAPPPGPASN